MKSQGAKVQQWPQSIEISHEILKVHNNWDTYIHRTQNHVQNHMMDTRQLQIIFFRMSVFVF